MLLFSGPIVKRSWWCVLDSWRSRKMSINSPDRLNENTYISSGNSTNEKRVNSSKFNRIVIPSACRTAWTLFRLNSLVQGRDAWPMCQLYGYLPVWQGGASALWLEKPVTTENLLLNEVYENLVFRRGSGCPIRGYGTTGCHQMVRRDPQCAAKLWKGFLRFHPWATKFRRGGGRINLKTSEEQYQAGN